MHTGSRTETACFFFQGSLWALLLLKCGGVVFFLLLLLSHQDSAANLNDRNSKLISLQKNNQALNDRILDHMATLFYCFDSKCVGHKINTMLLSERKELMLRWPQCHFLHDSLLPCNNTLLVMDDQFKIQLYSTHTYVVVFKARSCLLWPWSH